MTPMFAQAGFFSILRVWVFLALALAVLLAFGLLLIHFAMIYLRALFSGAKVTLTQLIALRLRRIPLGLVGYDRAARIAQVAQETGRALQEVALQMSGLEEAQLAELLDLPNLTEPGLRGPRRCDST
jgi:hypothetical protein